MSGTLSVTSSTPVTADPCRPRSRESLADAVRLLGETAELATDLARTLTTDRDGSSRKAQLQAMLVSERCLIQFVCGPHPVEDRKTGQRKKRTDDLCPQCFIPGWRLADNDLRAALEPRAGKINKQVAHLTWGQVERPREWTINKVQVVIDALEIFAADLHTHDAELGDALRKHLERVATAGSACG